MTQDPAPDDVHAWLQIYVACLRENRRVSERGNFKASQRWGRRATLAYDTLRAAGSAGERAFLALLSSGDRGMRRSAACRALDFAPEYAVPILETELLEGGLDVFSAKFVYQSWRRSHPDWQPPPAGAGLEPPGALPESIERAGLTPLEPAVEELTGAELTRPDDTIPGVLLDVINARLRTRPNASYEEELELLPPGLRYAHAHWRIELEHPNGGWVQLFWNLGTAVVEAALEGYRAIGAVEHARVTAEVLSIALREAEQHEAARETGEEDDFVEAYEWSDLSSHDAAFELADRDELVDPLLTRFAKTHPELFITR